MKISEAEYNELSYRDQEQYLRRCFNCQMKFNPFTGIDKNGYFYCDFCKVGK